MSELKEWTASEIEEYDDSRLELAEDGQIDCTRVYIKQDVDKVIEELKADYKEACDRLQTTNLIKDEQIAATRHQKYKRCLAMAKACHEKSERMYCEASTAKSINEIIGKEPKDAVVEKFEFWGAIASTHCKRWLKLAEKFKPNNSTAQ